MQICLKELRETAVWLRFADRLCCSVNVSSLTKECDELISIFVRGIKTAKVANARHRR
jgi:four helix bundle protein